MVERHDDELADRRASGGKPKVAREPAAAPGVPGRAAGALPLQWSEEPAEAETEAGAEAEEDDSSSPGGMGTTIDLTERAGRSGRDDLDVWSEVLRRRPAEAARLTGHPSAAGERLEAAGSPRRSSAFTKPPGSDDAVRPLGSDRRRGRGRPGEGSEGGANVPPPDGVSRLRPVESEPEPEGPDGRRKRHGSELATRVVTGIVVAGASGLIFNAGPGPAALLCAILVGIGVLELCTALRTQGYRPAVVIALLGSGALVVGAYNSGQSAFTAVFTLVGMGTLLWYLAGVVRARPAAGVATTFLAFCYLGVFGGYAGLILAFPHGVGLLLGLILCAVAHDIFGYLAGSRIGRRPIAPSISPHKTVEGLLVGMVGSTVVGFALVGGITPWDRFTGLALGAVVAVLAPLGDLCESMLKRDLGVKDLGGLLPGHGGVLDRIDAILFALPAVYYLIRLLEIV